ncbi:MAG: ribbon-helix-helix domain-containing protein [bacterium]|nr:ribbon-helix-helix domain-containing protein [bacterium]
MQTVNISLPEGLAKRIDEIVETEGYASRSELFRAFARFYLLSQEKPALLPFKKVSVETVKRDLRRSRRYGEKFIKSVARGLSRSSLYAQNKNTAQRP